MRLNHLALAVRDQQRSIAFYATYFGFDPAAARRYPDGVIIIRNGGGFAALGEDPEAQRAPGFPHFGFDTDSPDAARELRERLLADGYELVEEEETETYVCFKVLDPDRHVTEVSWET
jgi:catechol 2,3-dioxygenase-like lactoylglutathione lyase family enzyme